MDMDKRRKNKLEDNDLSFIKRQVKAKDIVTYYGIRRKKIFSSEPNWLVEMISNGELWLDDSDEQLYLYTTENGIQAVDVDDFIYRYEEDGKSYVDFA